MKIKSNLQKLQNTRRSFLKSLGIFVTGFSLTKPSLFTKLGIRKLSDNKIKSFRPHDFSVKLPEGVRAVWDIQKAYYESTPTRTHVCINGLWLWQPGSPESEIPPVTEWGYFKVPGPWPRATSFSRKNSQTVFAHPAWEEIPPNGITTAWYQREISIPEDWSGRRIILDIEYLNSYAVVYIDGKNAGILRFPAGEADITQYCHPGKKHLLSLKVTALPLQDVLLSFSDTNAVSMVKGNVIRRGLCGDINIKGIPSGSYISDIRINTFFRKEEISVNAQLSDLNSNDQYTLHAEILDEGKKVYEFRKHFKLSDLIEGRLIVTQKWKAEKLWDLHTPQNQYQLILSLLEGNNLLDMPPPVNFGYREFWIDGRDFYLNGSRIFLSALPIDNAQAQIALATYESIKETMLRLQGIGINLVFTHNYGCQPGQHLSFTELLKAADDTGMLVSFSQPHFGHYDWKSPDADDKNGYAEHAEHYVKIAQNHPSVVFYSTSHNSTGYSEDMNPDLIDGMVNRDKWAANNMRLALRAEAILRRLDPHKIVYHHSSGNLGSMHTSNFYTNWAPVQEKCEWLEHWSTKGVKPFFTCEYSDPATWDWTMYRGWYKGKRAFGSADVPWEFCIAEWNSQYLGDSAFRISEEEKRNLRWEAAQFREGKVWGRFDYPHHLDYKFAERYPVFAMSFTDAWRAYRTWEISANSYWEYGNFWRPRKGLSFGILELSVDWDNLQKPGFSPDHLDPNNSGMELYFERNDWIPSVASEAFVRNNMPLLAYIAGKPASFTSKDHNFLAGESFDKQLIIINNCRQTISCECTWSFNIPRQQNGKATVTVQTGQQERIPINLNIPASTEQGIYELSAEFRFSNGETQTDSFQIHVLPPTAKVKKIRKIALWDPKGETSGLISSLGFKHTSIKPGDDLSGYEILIIGKEALNSEDPALDLDHVREGLKVIVFEQKSEVLERRFGFRVQEYGLRNLFIRIPDHPLLSGLSEDNLRDWRGEATIIPPRLKYELSRQFDAPTVSWCGIPVTRQWRCGTRGNVASVLIEKPACGNFLPVLDGGFSLQYSPLMEYKEGRGMILFCQMDVTGRTENDPSAERLTSNIISYVSDWKPEQIRHALYAGEIKGKMHFENAGITDKIYEGGALTRDQVLILGPDSDSMLSSNIENIHEWLKKGGHLLAIGLDKKELNTLFPNIEVKSDEHISSFFEKHNAKSLFCGIGPSDLHNRAPKEITLITSGAEVIGNGVLAKGIGQNAVFCQMVPWHQDYSNEQHNIKQTFRRIAFAVNRLLGNMGVGSKTKLLERFRNPLKEGITEKRWLDDLYLDTPEEWDDPYRFFRW